MKRLLAIWIVLGLLLSAGCYRLEWNCGGQEETPDVPDATNVMPQTTEAVNPATTQDAAVEVKPTPESQIGVPTDAPTAVPSDPAVVITTGGPTLPDLSKLPIIYDVYQEVGWEVTKAQMFLYDIDLDGYEEEISFEIIEGTGTRIMIDSDSVLLEDGEQFMQAMLIDLDPSTPYVNLLISIDAASDDYVTTELHYVDKKIVTGKRIYDKCGWDEEMGLFFYERSDVLGTRSGKRAYHGEDLVTDTEWIDCSDYITPDRLKNERDELIEYGGLLHLTRDLPCEINGNAATIKKGSYIYMLRFTDSNDKAEISTESGTVATIHFTYSDWTFFINGKTVEKYFDNLFYAD